MSSLCRSWWSRCVRPLSATSGLLGLRVRIPPGSRICECCVFSRISFCDWPITRLEESYRVWCVGVWSRNPNNKKALAHYKLSRLTPWCRVLLEKLSYLQIVKKFPAHHGTRRFITALTSVRHLSVSWASPIQSVYPHPTSSPVSPPKPYTPPYPQPYAPHAQPISFFSILSPAQYWVRSKNYLTPRYAISSIPRLPRPS